METQKKEEIKAEIFEIMDVSLWNVPIDEPELRKVIAKKSSQKPVKKTRWRSIDDE